MKILVGLAFAFTSSLVGCSQAPPVLPAKSSVSGATSRDFHFEYASTIAGIPQGAKSVRMWVPLPQTDENQTISNLKIDAPIPFRETRDPLYGNRIAYFELSGTAPAQVPIRVAFDVHRVETSAMHPDLKGPLQARLLEGDRLAPTAGEASARAAQAVATSSDVTGKAFGIYNRVLDDVAYDKTVTGWGRGDLSYVCRVGKGNCSDFHALFISMARSQQIPALFEIGFPLPRDKHEGPIGGYHCWAWYQAPDGAWKPVDVSEADKDPNRKEYFFGTICCNRVALSRGRDIVLEPAQAGEPVNFLIYPYVEVDGKPLETGVEKTFAFRDLPPRLVLVKPPGD